jgi:hypothetical protein
MPGRQSGLARSPDERSDIRVKCDAGPGYRFAHPGYRFGLVVMASTAKQSIAKRHAFAISRRETPELHQNSSPLNQRAYGNAGRQCTRSLVCAMVVEKMHTSIHSEFTETSGIPARNGLRLIPRSPRRSGFLASVASRK